MDFSEFDSIASGVRVDLSVLFWQVPASNVALVTRLGSFYLNLSSDGHVRWSLHGAGAVASPLPVAMNRWVRMTASATTSALYLFLDGAAIASGVLSGFPSASVEISIGQGSVGRLDEVTILSRAETPSSIRDLGIRGMRLNPNATDTDFDGLADGQELFVKSVKTPKRYPNPDRTMTAHGSTWTPPLRPGLVAPAWAPWSASLTGTPSRSRRFRAPQLNSTCKLRRHLPYEVSVGPRTVRSTEAQGAPPDPPLVRPLL